MLSCMDEGREYFLGWGTLMVINAAIARSMGRSALVWFLWSILFGPLATLLLAIFGPPEKSELDKERLRLRTSPPL